MPRLIPTESGLSWELKLKRYIRNDNEWDRYVDKARRKIRVKTTGSVLGGTFYSLQLDCYAFFLELMILSVLSVEEPISIARRASKEATRKRRGSLNRAWTR